MRLRSAARRFLSVPVLALALGACGTSTYQYGTIPLGLQPEPAEIPVEIETVRPTFLSAWRGQDVAALQTFFTPEAVVVTPMGTYTGWGEISSGWLVPMRNYTTTPLSYVREGPAIIESGKYNAVVMGNGMPRNVSGTYSYRWIKTGNGWRLARVQLR